jgi:hypothetical protein
MTRHQAKPIRPRADRPVIVDGQLYRVKIRERFLPAKHWRDFRGRDFRWVFWSMPVWLLRRLFHRDDWTVTVFAVRERHRLERERRLHSERVIGLARAIERADALVEALESGSLLG